MKVAVLHNFYDSRHPSGENSVVLHEVDQLRNLGLEVNLYGFGVDNLNLQRISPRILFQNLKLFLMFRYKTARTIRRERPDLIHIHNLFPFVGFGFLKVAQSLQIPVIYSMHNYRVTCLKGTQFRRGKVCVKCSTPNSVQGVLFRCYRGSYSQSLLAWRSNQKLKKVLAIAGGVITLSPFMTSRISMFIGSNCLILERATPSETPACVDNFKSKLILFAGRISDEKGVELLCRSWVNSKASENGWRLVVAGDGPQFEVMTSNFASSASISFTGLLNYAEMSKKLASAALLVVPSIWFEGFPKVVSQAASNSCAVALNDIGSLGSLELPGGYRIQNNEDSWSRFFSDLNVDELMSKGAMNLKWWKESAEINTQTLGLVKFYSRVLES
jgi:glycosyltransferase involved in cell wall biosynthesis